MGKGGAGAAALLRVPVADRGVATKPREPRGASKYIGMRQASNIMNAVKVAKLIGVPLMAHLTIHWAYTNAGDDPNGNRFAKIREGLDKWLGRHGHRVHCLLVP